MKTEKYLFPILALALLASCEKHEQAVMPDDDTFTVSSFTAKYAPVDAPETKNEIEGVRYKVTWTEGDKIALVNLEDGTIHSYTVDASSVGEESGVFIADDTYLYNSSDPLVAVYPYNAASWSNDNLYVELKNAVTYNSATDIPAFAANDIQVSKIIYGVNWRYYYRDNHRNLALDRMVALVSTTCVVSSEIMREQTATEFAISHSGICGTAQVQFDGDGNPSVAASSGNGDRLAVTLTGGHAMNSISYVSKFIPVFPFDENNGVAFEVKTEDCEAGFYLKKDKTIESNQHQSFVIYDGNYTKVASKNDATTDHTWWLTDSRTTPPADKMASGELYYGEANCVVIPKGTLSSTIDVSLYEAADVTKHTRGSRSTHYKSAAKYASVIWCEEGLAVVPTLSWNGLQCTMTVYKTDEDATGNALIGLYDENNEILWSFHVWAPDDGRTIPLAKGGNQIYSRAYYWALGQITDRYDSYMYYQWGRKDPLGRAQSIADASNLLMTTYGSHRVDNYTSVSASSISGGNTLEYVRKSPYVFITPRNNTDDWYTGEANLHDDYLWNVKDGIGSIYDPCPKDYHVPSNNSLWYNSEVIKNLGISSESNWACIHRDLYYVLGGYRNGDDSLPHASSVRGDGFYWSSTPYDNVRSYNLRVYGSSNEAVPADNNKRMHGFGVRCVKD